MAIGDIPVVDSPMLKGLNKSVLADGILYVPPEVFDLMTDGPDTLKLILKHLPCVVMPRGKNAFTRLAVTVLNMGKEELDRCP